MAKSLKDQAKAEAERLEKKFGSKVGATGTTKFEFGSIPTGSLALDYALGTGGWPVGHPIEVYGPRDIGKSSIIGLNAIKNAQAQGKLCGVVAIEPGWDEEWAIKNGVDPDGVIIARPDSGEQAFEILHDWANDTIVDFMLLDSIGAILKESEISGQRKQAGEAKANVGGASQLITWGMKGLLMPTWKNQKCVMVLNQIRDDMGARYPGQVKTPGGRNLEHTCAVIVRLKQQGSPIKEKFPEEEDKIIVGRDLVAIIERNKLSEGSDRRAEFTYYQMDTPTHKVGIDSGPDVARTAIRTKVVSKHGGWYHHSTFPDGKLNGMDSVTKFIVENPDCKEEIRKQVLAAMVAKETHKEFVPEEAQMDEAESK
jgi:recombination protein RecA